MTATAPDIPKPPDDLSVRSAALWDLVLVDYEMNPSELEVFRCALVSLDRADQAAEDIREHGVTIGDRYGGRKSNPATDIEARNRTLYAALVRQLKIVLVEDDLPAAPRAHAKPGPRPKPARARKS